MAGDWTTCTVADVAAKTRNAIVGGPFGSDLVSRDYVDGGVPVIRGANMGDRWVGGEFAFVSAAKSESLAANHAEPGDIVFTQRGTLGQVALVPAEPYPRYLISQSQMKLTVDREKASPLFLYYVFRSVEQQEYIRKNAIQTGVPHTNLGLLKATPLALPPLAEQRAIARILGALDDKIELNRNMNATLEAMARALFKSWFVDFNPVRAKAEGHAPRGMDAETAKLFPSEFVDSELGPIPKGWRVGSIYELSSVDYGAPYASSKFNTEKLGLPVVRIRDLADQTPAIWTREEHPRAVQLADGDVVVGMDGEFRAHVWGSGAALLNQRACRFSPRDPKDGTFVRLSLGPCLEFVERTEVATTVIHLGKSDIDQFRVVTPSRAILDAFAVLAGPFVEKRIVSRHNSSSLERIRDALLPRLLSGELSVADAELVEARS